MQQKDWIEQQKREKTERKQREEEEKRYALHITADYTQSKP